MWRLPTSSAFLGCALYALGCGVSPPSEPEPEAPARNDAPSLAAVRGQAPRATGGFPSVVVLEPLEGPLGEGPSGEPPVMDQFGMAFSPRVLVAESGERIRFLNSEDVLHNVHVKESASGNTVFNVATIPYGSYQHRFEDAGVYDVSCDTHPAMAAFLFITESPWAVVAEPDGEFALADVPAGSYRLKVWNLDPARQLERDFTVTAPSTVLELVPPP